MGTAISRPPDGEKVQTLKEHLLETGDLASCHVRHLAPFHGVVVELAQATGHWHDLGKFNPEWQKYIRYCEEGKRSKSPGHALQGAILAIQQKCLPVAHAILGHHAGLFNTTGANSLKEKLKDFSAWQSIKAIAEAELDNEAFFHSPRYLPHLAKDELLTRIIFSALIDGDRQSAANFMGQWTEKQRPSLKAIQSKFQCYVQTLVSQSELIPINLIRQDIYRTCQEAAVCKPGFFRLTTPTGGGKTLSAMTWAINHALRNQQNRIIYCPPFTSIIEQTADIYRTACGEDSVLEHHGGMIFDHENELETYQLSAQRWDYPIIVTTTVQLFESLFSHKPSRCRKVHRIPNSVIILDEVQTLPIKYLAPILTMLRELVTDWGCSVVFCSATQPWYDLFHKPLKLPPACDIIGEPQRAIHFSALNQRVTYQYEPEPWTWQDLLIDLDAASVNNALVVVSTKSAAREGFDALLAWGNCFHLSTSMYPQHRRRVIQAVRERLKDKLRTLLVSTQLIEAGVDLDFERGYRVMTGLDSIIQTAGRVNRNNCYSQSFLKVIQLAGSKLLNSDKSRIIPTKDLFQSDRDPNHEATCSDYFKLLLSDIKNTTSLNSNPFDVKQINKLREAYQFREVGEKFQLIEEDYPSVDVIINEECVPGELIQQLQKKGFLEPKQWRLLYQYVVKVPDRPGVRQQVQEITKGVFLWQGVYHPDYGVIL